MRNPKFIMPEDCSIVCRACGGILRPVEEFVRAYLKEFTMALGHEPTFPEKKFVCIECGLMYNPDLTNTGIKIDWAEALVKHYQK